MTVGTRKALLIGAVALILGGTAAVMLVGPVAARGEGEEVRVPFGPVGIARGQTAVLNVVLLAVPPNPCRATLSFYDAAGDLVGSREEPAMAEVTLEEPNVIASFELPAVQAVGEGQVRAEILQLPPDPCMDLVATLEVYGPGDATRIYWATPGPRNAPAG